MGIVSHAYFGTRQIAMIGIFYKNSGLLKVVFHKISSYMFKSFFTEAYSEPIRASSMELFLLLTTVNYFRKRAPS